METAVLALAGIRDALGHAVVVHYMARQARQDELALMWIKRLGARKDIRNPQRGITFVQQQGQLVGGRGISLQQEWLETAQHLDDIVHATLAQMAGRDDQLVVIAIQEPVGRRRPVDWDHEVAPQIGAAHSGTIAAPAKMPLDHGVFPQNGLETTKNLQWSAGGSAGPADDRPGTRAAPVGVVIGGPLD